MAQTPWLSIIGIGDDGLDGLSPVARSVLDSAEIICGGRRHLAMLGDDPRDRMEWAVPFADSIDPLTELRGHAVAVLASGDPMWFGAGATLVRAIPASEMRIIPAPSAYSLAAARLGWALDEVECLSVHGRPLEAILPFLVPEARLLIYCHDGHTPQKISGMLSERGFGDSLLTALSHLGGGEEQNRQNTARDWGTAAVPNLTTLAIECVAAGDACIYPQSPGLPDEAYQHDGQLTKREVRAVTLAALAPLRDQFLWDVGAGCGSIGIEWCRAAKGAQAVAIEFNTDRVELIRQNALDLGVPHLNIVEGTAPEALADLTAPHAVFIGGGLSTSGVWEMCWAALKPGGRLVANAVTIEGEQQLVAIHKEAGGELVRLAVSRAGPVGDFEGWRPLMPVTQLRVIKK
ncbi:MAG: precorrin-6y C5,15-methyltransferase (decarboxylating) subunit CbiE [Rhodospirillaceae bacterium]|jgi:precorrin-6B C5,15-methyltransferase / cobalt-precorrin-6B C5,C15-methyltransferase|nr:precorrin-6y C5,15-methyltransferase (decarboxylating) subunit CbiE [Rhodospirillaceae bacterium]MBT5455546.1 precorrin-6y C5,15-methyltransferase (decarboxylating) subunit CbiE [Rhodospirillaceae bacterium]